MISVVVCSVNNEAFNALAGNIAETIGAPYEIIKIDNQKNRYSISAAYNTAASRARGSLLCFVHEDVRFRCADWGKTVNTIFIDKAVGLLGVAGATYYPLPPIGWFSTNEVEINIVQHFNQSSNDVKKVSITKSPSQPRLKAVVIDGVFMVTPKKVIKRFPFDEKMLPGFHGYDMDISLQIGMTFKIMLTKEILLEHFSEGRKDDQWHNAMQAIAQKWKNTLPLFTPDYTANEKREANIAALAAYYQNRLSSNQNPFCRFYKTFAYAVKQGLVSEAIKIVLRTLYKRTIRRC